MAKAVNKTVTRLKTGKTTSARKKKSVLVPEDIKRQMIAEAAYYISLNRAQPGGDPFKDWLLAEKQIEELLTHSTVSGKVYAH